jgi:iron complex transport system substrate-binding protein
LRLPHILFCLLLLSCGERVAEDPASGWQQMPNAYARSFQFIQRNDQRLLLLLGPGGRTEAILQVAGAAEPGAIQVGAVGRLVAGSTTHLPFIKALGRGDAVVGVAYADRIQDTYFRSRISNGSVIDVGIADGLDAELLLSLRPQFVTIHPFGSSASAQRSGLPLLPITEYLEEHPLGRAEWIKVFGALLDREAEADSIFTAIEQRYMQLASTASAMPNKPRVFFGSAWQGQWYAPGPESYMAMLIRDAGGDYVFAGRQGVGNITLDLESVVHKVRAADHFGMVVAVEGEVGPLVLAAGDSRLAELDAVRRGGFHANSAASDIFGSALLEPDVLLQDLFALFHPESSTGSSGRYFRRVAQ